jgi:hypothetical protein
LEQVLDDVEGDHELTPSAWATALAIKWREVEAA